MFRGIKNFSRIHLVDKWNGVSKVRAGRDGGGHRPPPAHAPSPRGAGVCPGRALPAGGGVSAEARLSSAAVPLRAPQVNYWHSDQCNMINGTAGQMWAPFMTPESPLEFYSPDACR